MRGPLGLFGQVYEVGDFRKAEMNPQRVPDGMNS
jgi:hypothetical protein